MPPSHNHFLTALLSLSGFLLFSFTDVLFKILAGAVDIFTVSFWSGLAGLVFLLACSPWLGGLKNTLASKKKNWHLVRALLTTFIVILNFVALKAMPLVNFYTIIFTAPFMTVLLARLLFQEKVGWKNWLVVGAGFCGVIVAMRPSIETIGLPELAVLTAAVFFALRNMTVPKMGAEETMLSYGLYTYAGITVGSLLALAVNDGLYIPPPNTWPLLFATGALGAIGVILLSAAFRAGPASIAATMHYSQIVWGIAFGMLVFGDFPDRWDLVGSAMVCLSGIYLIETGRRNLFQ